SDARRYRRPPAHGNTARSPANRQRRRDLRDWARGSARTVHAIEVGRLRHDLRSRIDGEVRFDAGTRGAYSTDASNFRQVPLGVVLPRTVDAAVQAAAVCREHGAPILSRGGGTSLAGQCANAAVVIDWSKYCHRLVTVDPERCRCVVEP